jgi:hypothetical protein
LLDEDSQDDYVIDQKKSDKSNIFEDPLPFPYSPKSQKVVWAYQV